MSASMNIDVPRNGHWQREFQLIDDEGEPINLASATIAMAARDIPGGTQEATATITKTEATEGRFEVLWDGADFDGYGDVSQIARPSYDCKVTIAGVSFVPFRGYLNILPESTA